MTNPIVPEEKPIKQHYDDLYNGYDTGFNACRQTVLNNLSSNETRERITNAILDSEAYDGKQGHAPAMIYAQAIITELTRGK